MRYLSVCSGIEAATVAWHTLGWSPIAFAEIDRFPNAVLQHHYPQVPNWGDIHAWREWPDATIDVLVGGTPCQSFSVAGLRAGLADPRGNLTLVFLAIVQRYRPRWVVWENVPGVLSANDGRDFSAFIGGLADLGYGLVWRVLDAQYFGVAQRRQRVFVVGHARDWHRAAAVLLERASLSGHPAPCREAREGVAGTLGGSAQSGGFRTTDLDNTGAFIPMVMAHGQANAELGQDQSPSLTCNHEAPVLAFGMKDDGADCSVDVSPTLRAGTHDGSHANGGVMPAVAVRTAQTSANGHGVAEDVAHTLDGAQGQAIAFKPSHFTRNKDGAPSDIVPPLSADADKGDQDTVIAFADVADPVAANQARTYTREGAHNFRVSNVAISFRSDASREGAALTPSPDAEGRVRLRDPGFNVYEDVAPTLDATAPHGVGHRMQVRRLTPRECERLQGFPDDYTRVPYRGKVAADGPRYKALGNSMAVPVVRWIGQRIHSLEALLDD